MALLDFLGTENAGMLNALYPSPLNQQPLTDTDRQMMALVRGPGGNPPASPPVDPSVFTQGTSAPFGFASVAPPVQSSALPLSPTEKQMMAIHSGEQSWPPASSTPPVAAKASGPSNYIAVGDYQMPQFGQAPTDSAALPANAQPAQGQLPPQQQRAPLALAPPQAQPQPAPQGPGVGDRLMNSVQGFLGNLHNGPIAALAGGVGSLVTGQRSDAGGVAQQSQRAIYDAVRAQPGMTREKAIIIATNPKAFEAYAAQLFDNNKYGFTKLDDGTIVRQDPRTGEVLPAYQATPKADWGVISKKDGEESYGWIDKNRRSISTVAPTEPRSDTITGPDGKQIAIPAGVDRKTFVNEVSRAGAKAAAGEKTEVQAKSEKFGNKMELAEKNLKGLDDQYTDTIGAGGVLRATEYLPGGNMLQTEKYQKYKQARDNFITALLRDESGAAIGSSEFNRYEKELFPQPGDATGVVKQKREARQIALEAMKKSAGPGYKSPTFEENTATSAVDDLLKKYGGK